MSSYVVLCCVVCDVGSWQWTSVQLPAEWRRGANGATCTCTTAEPSGPSSSRVQTMPPRSTVCASRPMENTSPPSLPNSARSCFGRLTNEEEEQIYLFICMPLLGQPKRVEIKVRGKNFNKRQKGQNTSNLVLCRI